MLIKEEDLRISIGTRIIDIIVGAAFLALGLAFKTGILDISVLVEAWSGHALDVLTVWWSYAGVGVLLLVGGVWPSSYKTAMLYADKIELTKKDTVTYRFDNIFDVSVSKRLIRITFKDGSAQVKIPCRKKSTFPYEVTNQFSQWKNSN